MLCRGRRGLFQAVARCSVLTPPQGAVFSDSGSGCRPSTHRCPNRVRSGSSNGKAWSPGPASPWQHRVLSTRVLVKSSVVRRPDLRVADSAHGASATMCKESTLEADVAKMTTLMWSMMCLGSDHTTQTVGSPGRQGGAGLCLWSQAALRRLQLGPQHAESGRMLSASVSSLEK